MTISAICERVILLKWVGGEKNLATAWTLIYTNSINIAQLIRAEELIHAMPLGVGNGRIHYVRTS